MNIEIKIDTTEASPGELEATAKQLRALADMVDPVPPPAREAAASPYYTAEPEGPPTAINERLSKLERTLGAKVSERAEALHDITTEIGKRVTEVEDKTTNLNNEVLNVSGRVRRLEVPSREEGAASYTPGLTPPPERTTLQREIEAAVNSWRETYQREFLVVSQPYYREGDKSPRSTVHTSGDCFAGTSLADGGTITQGLAGA